MLNRDKNYLILIVIHIAIGILIYGFQGFSKIYSALILFGGLYFVIKTKNRNNEVLLAAAYIVGSEVFLRMTNGNPNHEFSKYGVVLFLSMGMFYSGFSKNALPYWIFLILLIPGIIIGTQTLNLTTLDIRKTISFNISGPLALGIASLYCYNRKITFEEINNLLLIMGLPIVSCTMYLILYTPDLREIVVSTGSNALTSGGFGPNQVATALGLGMFIFFSRLILASNSKLLFFINFIIVLNITYRGLVTFSRGGMITGFVMILFLVFFTYMNSKYKGKVKLNYLLLFIGFTMTSIWVYTESQTGGLIGKRYANQDALGREKSSKFTGREEIASGEIDIFLENPLWGIGVAKGTEYRAERTGEITASHNEITRLLAEHGAVGILILLILIVTPIILYLDNKQNIFLFCFLLFWLLTINHAAMRTASPSFIYALSLLKVRFNKHENEIIVHREQIV